MRRWLSSSALVFLWFVVACGVATAAGAACPDKGPALTAPASGAQQDPPVTFTWSAVPGTLEYGFLISKSDGFLLTRFLAETALTLPLAPGDYKWRVDATAPGCPAVSSETRDLKVGGQLCPDLIPVPSSPPIGERVKSPVTLSWSAVPNATRYAALLFKDGAQVAEKIVEQPTVTIDLPAGSYDWAVETRTPTCPVIRSPFAFFVIPGTGEGCAVEPPKLLGPELMAEVTSPVTLSWTEVNGAAQYKVTLSHGGVDTVKTTTETKLTVELAAGGYDWRVEASSPGCPSLVSPTSFFRLICHKGAPQLISPSAGAQVTSPVEFKWSASPDAKGYLLLIRLDDHFFTEVQTTSASQTLNLPPGAFEWSVMAQYEGCPGEESARSSFKIAGAECASASVALIAPENQAVVSTVPVTFQWNQVEGAFAYQLLLAPADIPLSPVQQTKETSWKLALPPDRYRWAIAALRDGCPPIESAMRTFQLQQSASCNASAVPALVTPADGSTLKPPVDFTWTSVNGAVEYVLFVVRPDGTATPVGATQSSTTFHLEWLPAGKMQWFVAAIVPGCGPVESSRFSFEITQIPGCPAGRPFTLLPPDGAQNVPSHLGFEWTPLPGATSYQLWTSVDDAVFVKTGTEVTQPSVETSVAPGRIRWFVEAKVPSCPVVSSEPAFFTAVGESNACGLTTRPAIAGAAAVLSGETYVLRWSPVPGAASYELQEDTSDRFTSATSKSVSETVIETKRQATTPTPYVYRVRAIDSCQQPGPFSLPVQVVVQPKPSSSAGELSLFADVSRSDDLTQEIFIEGSGSNLETSAAASRRRRAVSPRPPSGGSATFTASTDVPWMTLTPASGDLPAAGRTITATIDPALLPAGTSRGVVKITRPSSGSFRSNGTTSGASTVVSVSKVTPVTPAAGSATARDGILIPLVTDGSTSTSALAVSNLSSSARKYELTFIPTDTDGTKEAKTTSIQVEPGQTALLEQILRSWFGASPGQTTQGSIQVRAVDSGTSTLSKGPLTVASALLSSTTAAGVLQTFIPKLPAGSFVESSTTGKLILGDLRNSASWSTAIGLMEVGGEKATAKVTVYDSSKTIVAQKNVDLRAREQTLLSDLLSNLTISGGRAEVELTSSAGKVTAFSHAKDTRSADEQVAPPIVADDVPTGRRLVPQAMNATDTNGRTETTDIWLYNASTSSVPLTLTLYPEAGSSGKAAIAFTLAAGETKLLEDVIGRSFQSDEERGMIEIDPGTASVVVSARNVQSGPGGTYSASLTPVSSTDGVAAGERTLQILHGRLSERFDMDLTLAEVSGKSATVEVMAMVPDSKSTPVTTVSLAANEMKRVRSILGTLGLTTAYNARITVRVTSGSGRVWAEGTLIDLATGDRSVIPAE